MSNAFLRSGLCVAEKIWPTVVKSLPATACGKSETSRSTGSVVLRLARARLAGHDVGVVVVRHQHVAGAGRSGAQYCAWPFGPITRS